jgi:hypothetical protein
MSFGSPGLTKLNDDEIKELLAALHRGHLQFPIRLADLIGGGLPHIAEKAEIVAGLDEKGLRALLVAVMAERRR